MKLHYPKQSQFELFPGAPEEPAPKTSPGFSFASLTFSFDSIVALIVVMVVSMVLSFSLGIERGKRSAARRQLSQPAAVPQAVAKEAARQPVTVSPDARQAEPPPAASRQPAQEGLPLEEPVEILQAGPALGGAAPSKKRVDKQYTIQVASFKKEAYARQEAMDLQKKGYESLVFPKGNYSIVCVGKFSEKAQAWNYSRKLKKRYGDLLVRSL